VRCNNNNKLKKKNNYSHMFNYEFHMIKSELNIKLICPFFYWMQGVDKYINIWVNLLHQNMAYYDYMLKLKLIKLSFYMG
jgi:hypothetical protein